MRYSSKIGLAAALGFALTALGPAQAADKALTIMMSVPGLTFPFFVHCVGEGKKEAAKLGDIELIISDGQVSSPKQTADIEAAITKGVDGMVVSRTMSMLWHPRYRKRSMQRFRWLRSTAVPTRFPESNKTTSQADGTTYCWIPGTLLARRSNVTTGIFASTASCSAGCQSIDIVRRDDHPVDSFGDCCLNICGLFGRAHSSVGNNELDIAKLGSFLFAFGDTMHEKWKRQARDRHHDG